ncbi:DUF378 domain-containing protein [Ureibacillus sp. Re31]|uniref:DUF378 domain-containing protein n=1 Tax=Ureibacillus galli TaxID=2762222 RepID=A0ABR8XGV2_9BACL|nr:DUF378 domain-containing protein [Ureibacillus galli]MBD8028462.1 DUF378 domain-containing protein [Ureibacillus galli]
MGIIYRIALVLVIIGAINWGLIGLFNFDLVATLFGGQETALSRIVYGLVGLAGLLCIPLLFRELKDDEVELADNRHSNAYTNMNYQTEFGEEPDFTKEERERALENYNNDGKDNKEDRNKNDLV